MIRIAPFAFAAYLTASSTAEHPRMRIVVHAEAIAPESYPAAVRTVATTATSRVAPRALRGVWHAAQWPSP